MHVPILSLGRNNARVDQLDESKGVLLHALDALLLDHVWDGARDVQALNLGPLGAAISIRHFDIVDHVLCDDVLLDDSGLGSNDLIGAPAGREEDEAVFDLLRVDHVDEASVRHHHGHLDLLEDAFEAFKSSAASSCLLRELAKVTGSANRAYHTLGEFLENYQVMPSTSQCPC